MVLERRLRLEALVALAALELPLAVHGPVLRQLLLAPERLRCASIGLDSVPTPLDFNYQHPRNIDYNNRKGKTPEITGTV